jgi:hypothetical protein
MALILNDSNSSDDHWGWFVDIDTDTQNSCIHQVPKLYPIYETTKKNINDSRTLITISIITEIISYGVLTLTTFAYYYIFYKK